MESHRDYRMVEGRGEGRDGMGWDGMRWEKEGTLKKQSEVDK